MTVNIKLTLLYRSSNLVYRMRVKCEQSDPRSNTTRDNSLIDHSKVDSAAASVNLSIQWKVQKYMQMSNVIGSIHCSLFRYMFSSYNIRFQHSITIISGRIFFPRTKQLGCQCFRLYKSHIIPWLEISRLAGIVASAGSQIPPAVWVEEFLLELFDIVINRPPYCLLWSKTPINFRPVLGLGQYSGSVSRASGKSQ